MSQTISILGCGWLGLPLAIQLKKAGFIVKGSTTTKEKLSVLKAEGIEPFYIEVTAKISGQNISSFFQSNTLVVTLPFRRDFLDPQEYKAQIDQIIEYVAISSIDFVIFTSSTAVYPDNMGVATEEMTLAAANPRAKVLLEIEQSLLRNKDFESTVVRFGGLYGGTRKIGRFLSGKEDLSGGEEPVNLIHLDDAAEIIKNIVSKNIRGEIFNAVSDVHPKRRELYTQAALKMGLPAPTFKAEEKLSGKIVSNAKLKKHLNYQFKYPDPLTSL